jgi:hypothetical protein
VQVEVLISTKKKKKSSRGFDIFGWTLGKPRRVPRGMKICSRSFTILTRAHISTICHRKKKKKNRNPKIPSIPNSQLSIHRLKSAKPINKTPESKPPFLTTAFQVSSFNSAKLRVLNFCNQKAMEATIGKFFESIGSFFSGGDQIPWCDRDIIVVSNHKFPHISIFLLASEKMIENRKTIQLNCSK